jgi:hypothetical protein
MSEFVDVLAQQKSTERDIGVGGRVIAEECPSGFDTPARTTREWFHSARAKR